MESETKIKKENKRVFLITALLFVLIFIAIFSVYQIYKTKQTDQDALSRLSYLSDSYQDRDPLICSNNRGVLCPNGVMAFLDEGSEGFQKATIQTEEGDSIWEYYFHSYWCVTWKEYLENKKIDLSLGINEPDRIIHCMIPEQIDVQKKLGRIYSSFSEAFLGELTKRWDELRWPKKAYKMCIFGDCDNKIRNITACLELGTCVFVSQNLPGLSYILPITPTDAISSIFDLFDPINKPPSFQLSSGSWIDNFPGFISIKFSESHY